MTDKIIMATLGGYPPRDEMLLWIGDAIATGQIDPVADLSELSDAAVRRLFMVAYTAVMGEGEEPPVEDDTPMGDLGAAYAADYARQRGRVSACCDAPVVFNNATGDHVCGLCRDRVEGRI